MAMQTIVNQDSQVVKRNLLLKRRQYEDGQMSKRRFRTSVGMVSEMGVAPCPSSVVVSLHALSQTAKAREAWQLISLAEGEVELFREIASILLVNISQAHPPRH